MSDDFIWVNGWEVHRLEDGRFGILNLDELVDGPFDTQDKALSTAIHRPPPMMSKLSRQAMLGRQELSIHIHSDDTGHTIEWSKNYVAGSLGPYVDFDMAVRVFEAKKRELLVNEDPA